MPELPEVETTRRGIEPWVAGHVVAQLIVRTPKLRWPVPPALIRELPGQRIERVTRRAKYLLLETPIGSAIVHLGMSGSLRVVAPQDPLRKHDHIDLLLDSGSVLRFHDPRRFGAWLWQPVGCTHRALRDLGPEPLAPDFNADDLWRASRGRRASIKNLIMDQRVLVGVGNIYAAEALFHAGIDPRRAAGRVARARYSRLGEAVRQVLGHAIARGGTTLRDFVAPDGAPGYFEQELYVYGRAGQPCKTCGTALKQTQLGQRASVWCPRCQT